MTLPNERYRAINNAREFLRKLLDPKQTPRVPKKVRKEAYYALKHYPGEFDTVMLAEAAPKILDKGDDE